MEEKVKIAFINIYQNKVYRGAETFVYELSRRLSKKHKVNVLTSLNPLDLLKNKYDIVIPTNGRLQATFARVITWLYGGKVLISGQSGIGFDDRLNLYTFPNVFVALSDYQTTWAKRINPFIRVVKIPNGVDLKKKPVKNLSIDLPRPIILSVGALEKNKRHDLTIQAVSKLPSGSLLIVGKGSEEENMKRLGSKYLAGRFKIISASYNEMGGIYRLADVFAFPTVPWESFGIAMVEAMAAGLPVVANNDPIRREIVGDAGILVDPTDIGEYAKVLEKVLDADWGNVPRKQAEKFDWDKITSKYEKLIEEVTE